MSVFTTCIKALWDMVRGLLVATGWGFSAWLFLDSGICQSDEKVPETASAELAQSTGFREQNMGRTTPGCECMQETALYGEAHQALELVKLGELGVGRVFSTSSSAPDAGDTRQTQQNGDTI